MSVSLDSLWARCPPSPGSKSEARPYGDAPSLSIPRLVGVCSRAGVAEGWRPIRISP